MTKKLSLTPIQTMTGLDCHYTKSINIEGIEFLHEIAVAKKLFANRKFHVQRNELADVIKIDNSFFAIKFNASSNKDTIYFLIYLGDYDV